MLATQEKRSATVVIVGAGVAGLSAARALRQHGVDVIVVEAGPCIGGRIVSHPWNNIVIDLGAQWIHGIKGNPITELAHHAGVKCIPTDFNHLRVFFADGTPLADRDLEAYGTEYERLTQQVINLGQKAPRDKSAMDGFREVLKNEQLTDREWSLLKWFWNATEVASAVDMEDMSLRYMDDDDAFDGGDCMFREGFKWLPDLLAKGLDIHLNVRVQKIIRDTREVILITSRGEYRAQRVIVAVPLGVLQKNIIQFRPDLPDRKKWALRNLAMGTLNKLVLEFPRTFWDDDRQFLGFINPHPPFFPVYMNMVPILDRPILMGFVGGKMAKQLEKMKDEAIVDIALRPLRKVYHQVPEPTRHLYTRWHSDNRFFGAYSHVPVGGTSEAYDVLAEPLDQQIFFAGEATSRRYRGTVHGAYLSGHRAAKEVLKILEQNLAITINNMELL